MKKTMLLSFILLLAAVPVFASCQKSPEPVLLTVFVYDLCGGCSSAVESVGCGECKDINRYHGIVRVQMGDRLYDGSIEYRILNCRENDNNDISDQRGRRYGVPEELLLIRPMTYIGTEDRGLYLPGEDALHYVKEALDRYQAGEDVGDIQGDIMSLIG